MEASIGNNNNGWERLAIVAIALLSVLCFYSCASPKNIERETSTDYSEDISDMNARMDSLLVNMNLVRKENRERLSNLKIENKTVYLSVPDSTGRQYITSISETTAHKEDKETTSAETELNATIQRLSAEVSELRAKLEAKLSEKQNVVQVSWWQLHKVDVYAVLFALVIVGWLVYRIRNK